MHEIGERVHIAEDHRWAWVYNVHTDNVYHNNQYYHVVWNEEDLYKPWPKGAIRTLFWESDLLSPKTRTLKNGNKLIISR